ncbi:MAG: chemotaxis protein CheD [Candidatus Kariarchaeaceae archaeon]|jgi:chemotaxis protein CheD
MDENAKIGDIIFGRKNDTLAALGLGSCVAVAIFDIRQDIAVLAHIALPEQLPPPKRLILDDHRAPGRFADLAIDECLRILRQKKSSMSNLQAKIAGGSRMFGAKDLLGPGFNIGERNIRAVRELLENHNIPIIAEDVGGQTSRTIYFDVNSKKMTIRKAFKTIVKVI